MNTQFDLVNAIMRYEDGTLPMDEVIALFQYLIDTGMAWTLQGFYGCTAMGLIDAGLCEPIQKQPINEGQGTDELL